MGSQFGVGEFTTHFRTCFSGDWDVHWGCDLDLTHGHIAGMSLGEIITFGEHPRLFMNRPGLWRL